MSMKTGTILMTERPVCPRCGQKRGYGDGVRNNRQCYKCHACWFRWRGEIPPRPDRTCPYCHGHCQKAGTKTLTGQRSGRLTPLQQWLGDTQRRPPERVQYYRCTLCGRNNTELWPETRRPGKTWGPCRYQTVLLLNSAAEEALAAYCRKHKLQWGEALRTIFREASYVKVVYCGRLHSKPPELPPDTPMPPLSDGRIKEAQKRRGKLFGHREVIIVRRITVNLDPVSYRGLLRTMQAKNMTRQEAARCLILATPSKCVGQFSKSDDDW